MTPNLEPCGAGGCESVPGWCTRQRRRQASHDAGHPLLAVLLALVFAVLGVVAALSRSVDEDPKLALSKQFPEAVGTLIESVTPTLTDTSSH